MTKRELEAALLVHGVSVYDLANLIVACTSDSRAVRSAAIEEHVARILGRLQAKAA